MHMKEKLLWSSIVILGLLLVLVQAQTPGASGSQVGRYQIATVCGNAEEQAQVFRLDTVTGKTWVKVIGPDVGGSRKIMFTVVPDYSASQQ